MRTVPDYRNQFLRGQGDKTGAVGSNQSDTMRPITGSFAAGGLLRSPIYATGALYATYDLPGTKGAEVHGWHGMGFRMNSGLLGEAYNGSEIRPMNIAVKYLIKAQ